MNVNFPSNRFPKIFFAIVNYAEKLIKRIEEKGEVLPAEKWHLARTVGIKFPYELRILKAPISFSDCPAIKKLAKQVGLNDEKIAGLAIGHCIMIHPEYYENDLVFIHELRHVAQFIACGSMEIYLDYYLMELIYFGYGQGPFENDASLAPQFKFQC